MNRVLDLQRFLCACVLMAFLQFLAVEIILLQKKYQGVSGRIVRLPTSL